MRQRRPPHDGRRPRRTVAPPYALGDLQFELLEERRLLAGVPELLAEINAGGASDPAGFVKVGGEVFFRADDGTSGPELWITDGTMGGTMMVKDIAPLAAGSSPEYLTEVNGTLFFAADNGTDGVELWMSDGTPAGTMMVKDINPLGSSSPGQLTNVAGTLYFRADDGTNGAELWTSDGTPGGTMMVMDIHPAGGSDPDYLTSSGGKLFFRADNGANGAELWMSDPNASTTMLVKDINPGSASSNPGFFGSIADVGGTLFFSANDGTNGFELWKSDGTPGGTAMVKNIRAGAGSSFPFEMADVGGTLFFTCTDGTHGFELWKSDGSSLNTTMVKDINTNGDSGPDDFVNVGGTLFFRANDGTSGTELWKSDGTPGGTTMVKDINLTGGSLPLYLTNVNGTLYFRATEGTTGTSGTELWQSDGTMGGTMLVADLAPLQLSSNPQSLTNAGGTLLFSAADSSNNQEPWILRPGMSSVAGTRLFYNESAFDNDSAAADAFDDSAIATDKTAYLPGSGLASFANVSSYLKGINGVMIDLAGWHGSLSAADFTLQTGMSNTPANWPQAPAPVSVTVRPGAGVSGSDRVELIWATGAIEKTWLQVIVKSNFNTNLDAPYTFLFGNYTGETGFGNLPNALVIDFTDEVLARNSVGIALSPTNPFDFNRDAIVDATDEIIARNNHGFLPLLDAGPKVLGRYLFYNQSVFDGNGPGADPSDDSAIATDKTAYLAGSGGATFDNMSSYTYGINGIMIDISGSHPGITDADFTFRTGDNNSPGTWASAPAPTIVLVRAGAGASGSDRVELIWANGAIQDTWLEVTVAANGNTGLASPDIFYFGSRIGDVGIDIDPTAATTDATDQIQVRNNQGVALLTSNPFDFNRDAIVDVTDELIARNNAGFTIKINVAAPPSSESGDGDSAGTAAGLDAVASVLGVPGIPESDISAGASSRAVTPRDELAEYSAALAGLLDKGTKQTRGDQSSQRPIIEIVADAVMLDDKLLEELLSEWYLE